MIKESAGLEITRTPNFLIVGAAKSGTSSLHTYLSKHPDIYMPTKQKELYFWHAATNPNKSIIRHLGEHRVPVKLGDYLSYFNDAEEGQLTGEACPSYLYFHDHVLNNLKRYHADWENIKIVIILREPVSRIISQYRFVCNKRLDPDCLDFCESLKAEKARRIENKVLPDLFYVDSSRYVSQVGFYLKHFKNVHVCLYDDLKENPRELLTELCGFLEVDSAKLPKFDFEVVNASSEAKKIKHPVFEGFVRSIASFLLGWLPKKLKEKLSSYFNYFVAETVEIPGDEILKLRSDFVEEVSDLEKLIDKNLSRWKVDAL